MTSAESRITLGPGGYLPESTSTLERMDVRYGRVETRTMAKAKSPPGYEEASLEGLKAEWVALAQRCTRMETELTDAIKTNQRCISNCGVIAFVAFLISFCNAAWLVWKAWS